MTKLKLSVPRSSCKAAHNMLIRGPQAAIKLESCNKLQKLDRVLSPIELQAAYPPLACTLRVVKRFLERLRWQTNTPRGY